MTSDSPDDLFASADFGLLSPAWAGSAVAAATGDTAVLRAMLDAEVALAEAQARLGLVPDAAVRIIRTVASVATFDLVDIASRSRVGGNPVIPLLADLRAAVAAADWESAGFVHLGATSQDILDTALMLVAKRSIRVILGDLDTAIAALVVLTDSHRETLMAARTLTQHSVPTTFAVKAAGWLVGLVDAAQALRVGADALPAQLGGAAGTLAAFSELVSGREFELVDEFAAELGLRAPVLPWHTCRAPVTGVGDALATVAQAIGTIGSNIALLSRTEIAEVHEATGGGSTAMPQKQNPIRSLLLQAIARTSPGLAGELHRSALSVDERPDGAWHAEWQALRELLRQVGGGASLAAELLQGLKVDAGRMRQNLELTGPLIVSERVALVAGPIIGRDAVKRIVSQAAQDPSSLGGLLKAALPDWSDDRVRELLDPANHLGANNAIVDRAIAHARGLS
ncbi:MAG TPA: lyase family protein [Terrimesophilobacter sp.]|uniref:lyase family protein n=1 Tax=Terrimesophilobacter sp. TaxID=2906435 RepID=UPI002F937E18